MHGRAVVLLLAAGFLLSIWSAGCRPADTPVARVNDVLISNAELHRFINLLQLCNPEAVLPVGSLQEGKLRSRSEQEILHILIGFELVNQAAAQAGLVVAPGELNKKTEEFLKNLAQAHYAGSLGQLHRRCKKLGLSFEDLEIFARYELQAEALFNRIASTLDEADLMLFIEEHPELFYQPAAAELYRFRFAGEREARACLAELQRGVAVEKIAGNEILDFTGLGWVAEDDPFLKQEVRERLFPHPRAGTGCLIASGGQYDLYWVEAAGSARQLEFEEVKEEAALRKNSLLYEQFYYSLWSEGSIEVFLP